MLLTVIAADYALIVGGYTLVVLIASFIQRARKEGMGLASVMSDLAGRKLL
jgi:hypothetical protein